MIERSRKRIVLCTVILCLNLAFIWGNSLLPGEISGAISGWIKNLINCILNLPAADPEQGHGLLRKLAHFTEFACLGAVLSCLIRMLREKSAEQICLPLFGGFLTACIDETIQCFVPDRGPGILDVGIDTAGVALGVGISCLMIVRREGKKRKRNQHNETNDLADAGAGDSGRRYDSLQKK